MTLIAFRPATVGPSGGDPFLRRWGLELARQHRAEPDDPSRCSSQQCRPQGGYPCHRRRIADRLIAASAAGWPQCWTARHDALSCGLSPSFGAAGVTAQQVKGPVAP